MSEATGHRPRLYKTKEVADELGVSERHARRLLKNGEIRSLVVGKTARRVRSEDLDAYIEQRLRDSQ